MKKRFQQIIEAIEHRPWFFIIAAALLTVASAPGILRLEMATGMETLISPEAQVFRDTRRHDAEFGSEPVVVFLEGELKDIFSPANLGILEEFEDKISENGRFHSILGPITVLQLAIEEAALQQQAFKHEISLALESAVQEAMRAAALQGLGEEAQAALIEQAKARVMQGIQPYMEKMAQVGEASLENPRFVNRVLYDENGQVSPAMAAFIPAAESVLIRVSPAGNLPYETSLEIVEEIEHFFLRQPLDQVAVTVVADVEIVETIAEGIGGDLTMLLGLAVVVMALILLFIFQVRWRLLSLFMVGISAVWTFGLMGFLGVPLSMATMAVLPVLIGLGIDYAIQFHNRYQEELAGSDSVAEAVIISATRMFPAAGMALVATIIGFITLYISEVPMVRDFGIMLAVGVLLSYVAALFLLHSILYLADRKVPFARLKQVAGNHRWMERVLSRMARGVIKAPALVVIVALAFGVAGSIADQRLQGSTDFKELMPPDAVILQDLERLVEAVGHGPSLRFLIEAEDITDPGFLNWLYTHQEEL
ncbi:MMPL family transporter [Dehalococcoidia bacterium]|nr:MMPL family transporter [Dehalococcoidia bacterium]